MTNKLADHALALLSNSTNANPERALLLATQAQVYATLALVAEQRSANRLAAGHGLSYEDGEGR